MEFLAEDKNVARRITAIVIADVYGYTRLMEADEEYTCYQISQHREAFTRFTADFAGRVIDTTGDSILSEYASVQSAIECAAKFQEYLEIENRFLASQTRMQFRIGVHVGDVLDDGNSLYGDAINTTARLQELADPGGICVSGVVHDLIDGRVPYIFHFVREQYVKNKSRSVRVFQMAGLAGQKVINFENQLSRFTIGS